MNGQRMKIKEFFDEILVRLGLMLTSKIFEENLAQQLDGSKFPGIAEILINALIFKFSFSIFQNFLRYN